MEYCNRFAGSKVPVVTENTIGTVVSSVPPFGADAEAAKISKVCNAVRKLMNKFGWIIPPELIEEVNKAAGNISNIATKKRAIRAVTKMLRKELSASIKEPYGAVKAEREKKLMNLLHTIEQAESPFALDLLVYVNGRFRTADWMAFSTETDEGVLNVLVKAFLKAVSRNAPKNTELLTREFCMLFVRLREFEVENIPF